MEVFLGELLGGVAGGIDYAYGAFPVEGWDGQGVHPAGAGACLGKAPGPCSHDGGLGGAEHETYGALVGGRERLRVSRDPS